MPKDNSTTVADRVVEVYAAANAIEAQCLCTVLEEDGIRSQVVGEQLGNAAGCLPLGETIAPRIWVRQVDARRAREIIEDWVSQSHEEWGESFDGDDQSELEEEPEEDVAPASGVLFRWFSQGLTIAGAACILIGAVWAGHNWITMQKLQGTAEGVFVDCRLRLETSIPPRHDDNIPGPRWGFDFSFPCDLQYEFVVDGKTYYAVVRDGNVRDRQVPIYYDLIDPKQNVVGPLTRPWTILVSTWGIGALLLAIGYYGRGRDAQIA